VPYLFATTFIADTASFLLPVSNPINVLLLGERIDLPTFFRFLLAPALFAILANYFIFAWWFRHDLRMVYDPARLPVLDSRRQQTTRLTLSGLAVLALVEVTAAWYHLPLGPVAVLGACALALLVWRIGQLDWKSVVRGISWSLFGFLTGMVIVVRGLTELGLTERFGTWLLALGAGSTLRAILVTAFGTALGANLINNVPMALVMRAALESSAPATLPQEALRYAACSEPISGRTSRPWDRWPRSFGSCSCAGTGSRFQSASTSCSGSSSSPFSWQPARSPSGSNCDGSRTPDQTRHQLLDRFQPGMCPEKDAACCPGWIPRETRSLDCDQDQFTHPMQRFRMVQ
jgi:di/tricarboxylate transporter